MDEIYPLVEKTNTPIDTEINNQNTSPIVYDDPNAGIHQTEQKYLTILLLEYQIVGF